MTNNTELLRLLAEQGWKGNLGRIIIHPDPREKETAFGAWTMIEDTASLDAPSIATVLLASKEDTRKYGGQLYPGCKVMYARNSPAKLEVGDMTLYAIRTLDILAFMSPDGEPVKLSLWDKVRYFISSLFI